MPAIYFEEKVPMKDLRRLEVEKRKYKQTKKKSGLKILPIYKQELTVKTDDKIKLSFTNIPLP